MPNADDVLQSENADDQLFLSKRHNIRNSQGLSYDAFRKQLRPSYWAVWLQILGAEAILFLIVFTLMHSQVAGALPTVFAIAISAALIGYLVAFLNLWLHEALHFNIHPNRRINDWLAYVFLAPVIGLDVKNYRRSHYKHHVRLGETDDPERNYFYPLTWRFILGAVTGLSSIHALLAYRVTEQKKLEVGGEKQSENGFGGMLLIAFLLHGSVVVVSGALGVWPLALAWSIGVCIVFPLLASVRQLLEHRRPDAVDTNDYSLVPHGAYTRVFDSGLFSSTFGAAGFNRHLIHHWAPQLSCTNFADIERFLEDSQLGDFYRSRKFTYLVALKTLLHSRWR